jgi:hypothetical protein
VGGQGRRPPRERIGERSALLATAHSPRISWISASTEASSAPSGGVEKIVKEAPQNPFVSM